MFVTIAILDRHDSAYGAGVYMGRKIDDDDDFEVYGNMSLFLPKAEYPSIRQSLIHIFAEVCKYLPPDVDGVCFRSTIPYLRDSIHRMKLKAGVFSDGVSISFKHLRTSPKKCMKLATDAGMRGSSVIEIGELT